MIKTIVLSALAVALVICTSQPQYVIDIFDRVDKDTSNGLKIDEFSQVFVNFDLTGNKDGNVTEKEFLKAWVDVFQLGGAAQGQSTFKRIDTNDDGVVNEHDLPMVFASFDENENGEIDLSEFLTRWDNIQN